MADVAAVRAEIKAWERAFKQNNGRHPTVDDIRSQPSVAEKYKLYKTLTKASSSAKASQSSAKNTPTTPPRGKSKSTSTTLLASTSRAAESTAPLPAFNPFSPQKRKSTKPQASRTTTASRTNLFASPVKGKAAKTASSQRFLSPDPFPEIAPSINSIRAPLLSQQLTPETSTAVSRARKRLRGDPVSPSPDKRRRLTTTPMLARSRPGDSDDEDDPMSGDASFVDDSPVKAPAGFMKLFDEQNGGKGELKRTSSFALFGAAMKKGAGDSDDEMDTSADGHAPPPKLRSAPKLAAKKFTMSHAKTFGNPMHLTKDNLFAETGPGDDKPAAPSKPSRAQKRSSSRAVEQVAASQPPPTATHEETILIPPSPPPADSHRKTSYMNAKGKAAAKSASRKKAKVDDEDGSTSDAEDEVVVKVFNRHPTHTPHEDDDDFDGFDPALLHTNRRGASPRAFDMDDNGQVAEETLEVNLPEDLRRILDIAPEERTAREERRLAEGLVYGRRVGHYDPKAGEIWDVGEDEGTGDRADTEEEDWEEGEGVPWAAGEL
ncbi:DNA replication and checkpoint protein-domain-containing protein [Schizophyllum commune]